MRLPNATGDHGLGCHRRLESTIGDCHLAAARRAAVLDLDGFSPGTISQSFGTIVGQTYVADIPESSANPNPAAVASTRDDRHAWTGRSSLPSAIP